MEHEKRSSVKQVVKDLISEDGWKGFYRGFGPRFFSMSAWGTSMILTYEYLSKKSSTLIKFSLCLSALAFMFMFYDLLLFSRLVYANIGITA